MGKNHSLPRILAEYGNTVIVDFGNCYVEEPLHSLLMKAQRKYVVSCANLCDGKLIGTTETTHTYEFFDKNKERIFKNSFARA